MTAWGDGAPAPHGSGAFPQAGPPRRNDDTRIVILVAMFTTAIVLVGVGAFLVGRGPSSGSGDAGVTATVDAPLVTPTVTTTPSTTTPVAPSTPAATTAPETTVPPTTVPPTTVAPTTAAPTTVAPTTTQALVPVDNSARARADLEAHFDNHDRVDLDAAYAGLTESFAPPFDEFVAFWGTDVADVDSPIDDCSVTGTMGNCTVRFFITYSDVAADKSVRGSCSGQLVDLTMQEIDGRFLIADQRTIEPLACP